MSNPTRSLSLDVFTRAYITAMLWSETDNSTPQGGEPLDANYKIDDISDDLLRDIITDCTNFQFENRADIADDLQSAGHDFWLTRNGHGAGFWDGDWPTSGDRLTAACKKYKSVNVYVGDDGKLYA